MKLKTLRDALIHELRDLYNAEQQLLVALPQMAEAATNEDLQEAFEEHHEETEGQIARLDEIFEMLDEKPEGEKCVAMQGLIAEGTKVIEGDADPAVRDALIIAAAQKIEHYEIAGYGTARNFAEVLGEDEIASILSETLDEEASADDRLTDIATSSVNEDADEELDEDEEE